MIYKGYIYKIDNYTPGRALNFGIKNCNNDNILILSAHSEIIQIDYEKVLEQLKKYCAVFGRQIPIWNGKAITPRYIWSHFGLTEAESPYSKLENRYFLHNAFSFYKKDILTKYEKPVDPLSPTRFEKEQRNKAILNYVKKNEIPRNQIGQIIYNNSDKKNPIRVILKKDLEETHTKV